MKKIFYILSIALLGAVACEKQFGLEEPGLNAPEEGAKVTLYFSIPTAPATKGAMTKRPSIVKGQSTVHVFVFNANSGALLEVSEAVLEENAAIGDNTPWGTTPSATSTAKADFSAEVTMGSAPRYLQFVVDAPTHTLNPNNPNDTGMGDNDHKVYRGDSESSVASKLITTNGVTAFWQRISLANGLSAYKYPGGVPVKGTPGYDWKDYDDNGTTDKKEDDTYVDSNGNKVYFGDYVDIHGHKITDGTGYIMSDEVAALIKFIPVVRNFVQIDVSKADGGNFTPLQAFLVNVPSGGYVAPYSAASGFVSYYLSQEKLNLLQAPATIPAGDDTKYGTEGVASTGYTAPVPDNEIIQYYPDSNNKPVLVGAQNGVISLFMYERGVATDKPTQLLVQGTLNNATRWFKFDVTDEDGNYVAFYRDFTYPMKIGTVTGTTGYGSMEAALAGPAIGNPSASPETTNLNEVTDGKGVGIYVDFIDYPSFDETGETVRLRYKFWDKTGTKTSSVTPTVTHTTGSGAVVSMTAPAEYSGRDTQDGETGWYYVNVQLKPQGNAAYKSVVRISGTGTNNDNKTVTLYRDVTFSVMPTQTFSATIGAPVAGAPAGTTHSATITLNDGLGFGLFPIVIRIEAYNGSINPTDADLPVAYGKSTFSALATDDDLYRTTNSWWFNKTIDFEEYNAGARNFVANFKTIYSSGNATTVLFSDSAGHFVPVKKELQ